MIWRLRFGVMLLLIVAGAAQAAAPSGPDFAVPGVPYRAPYVPQADDQVLQEVPAASDPAMKRIAALRAKLNADPRNLRTADSLARAYIDFSRELGDAHYAGYAEAVIAPWMAMTTPPVAAMVVQATILQYRHKFERARKLLEKALGREPQNAQAWLTLATIDMVQGDYAAADKDCVETGRAGGLILGIACSGNLRLYVGHARQSIVLLQQIDGDAPKYPATFKAWVQGLLAECFERLGEWKNAERHFRKALAYT
ncbi:MAG: tetratricopeptide repeat protein, partial [Casimicrobiaceae bacterium]